MIIKVERCFGLKFRLTLPNNQREIVHTKDGDWTRKQSSETLNLLEYIYKLKRKNIKFYHI